MFPLALHVDQLLRGTNEFAPHRAADRSPARLLLLILVVAPLYGAFMGSFHLVSAERLWMVVFSALKLPLLLFTTTAICLPGFFVLNTVLGLREDFRAAMQAILAGQGALAVALAALAPLTRFFYFSSTDYNSALLFNAAMFTLATTAGQIVMLRDYRLLITRHRRHIVMLCTWVAMYAFVGIQTAWMLRPFVGSPNMPVTFFRQEPFSNAYVVVARLILG